MEVVTMISIHPQYIVDEQQHKMSVVLPYKEWEKILEEIEELEDIRAYDAEKSKGDDVIPFDQAVKEIKEKGQQG
jgi:hypothetical protein